jgi:hypothetical protein
MPLSNRDPAIVEAVTRLISASNEDRTFDAAQMQLVNLSDIIRGAGEKWDHLKDKNRAGSLNFIKGCVDEDDIVIPAGDGFLIIFGQQESPEILEARAHELRDMLIEFYLGEEELRRLKIKVGHCTMSSKDLGALMAPPPTPPIVEPEKFQCLFAPMWTPQANMVASYMCTPVHHDAAGLRYGYDPDYAETGANAYRDYCELDIDILDAVEQALARYGAEDARPAIGVSVHSTTMQNRRARGVYLERLSKFPPDQLKHIFVRIAEIECGAPSINIADWAGMLRARIKNIVLENHHSERAPVNLSQIGVWGAGFQLPLSASREGADLSTVAVQVRRWGEALTRQRLRFFIDNLRRPVLIRLAAESGARFISSDAVWPFQKRPGGIVSAASQIFSHFQPGQNSLSSPPA